MSYDSHQTQCNLLCDETSEVCDAGTFWQDDSSPLSSVVTEDVVTAIDDMDGSAGSKDSDGSHYSDGSGFPHEAEVPKDVVWKTENVAMAGRLLQWLSVTNVKCTTRRLVTLGRQGYVNPHPLSNIAQIAQIFGYTNLMVAVGTSYFRRLMKGNWSMNLLAQSCPDYSQYVQTAEEFPKQQINSLFIGVRHALSLTTNAWLTLMFLTCIYLAAKVLEQVPHKNLLATMMSHIYGCEVDSGWGAELEIELLQALDWRIGPIYSNSCNSE